MEPAALHFLNEHVSAAEFQGQVEMSAISSCEAPGLPASGRPVLANEINL